MGGFMDYREYDQRMKSARAAEERAKAAEQRAIDAHEQQQFLWALQRSLEPERADHERWQRKRDKTLAGQSDRMFNVELAAARLGLNTAESNNRVTVATEEGRIAQTGLNNLVTEEQIAASRAARRASEFELRSAQEDKAEKEESKAHSQSFQNDMIAAWRSAEKKMAVNPGLMRKLNGAESKEEVLDIMQAPYIEAMRQSPNPQVRRAATNTDKVRKVILGRISRGVNTQRTSASPNAEQRYVPDGTVVNNFLSGYAPNEDGVWLDGGTAGGPEYFKGQTIEQDGDLIWITQDKAGNLKSSVIGKAGMSEEEQEQAKRSHEESKSQYDSKLKVLSEASTQFQPDIIAIDKALNMLASGSRLDKPFVAATLADLARVNSDRTSNYLLQSMEKQQGAFLRRWFGAAYEFVSGRRDSLNTEESRKALMLIRKAYTDHTKKSARIQQDMEIAARSGDTEAYDKALELWKGSDYFKSQDHEQVHLLDDDKWELVEAVARGEVPDTGPKDKTIIDFGSVPAQQMVDTGVVEGASQIGNTLPPEQGTDWMGMIGRQPGGAAAGAIPFGGASAPRPPSVAELEQELFGGL